MTEVSFPFFRAAYLVLRLAKLKADIVMADDGQRGTPHSSLFNSKQNFSLEIRGLEMEKISKHQTRTPGNRFPGSRKRRGRHEFEDGKFQYRERQSGHLSTDSHVDTRNEPVTGAIDEGRKRRRSNNFSSESLDDARSRIRDFNRELMTGVADVRRQIKGTGQQITEITEQFQDLLDIIECERAKSSRLTTELNELRGRHIMSVNSVATGVAAITDETFERRVRQLHDTVS